MLLLKLRRTRKPFTIKEFNEAPIVREDDEKAFGCYLTRDFVLAYMNAVAAGDLATVVRI